LRETEEFAARQHRPTTAEILRSLRANWRIVSIGALLVVMTTVSFYMITAYTPTFGSSVLHLTTTDSLLVTLCVALSNLFWLPVMGSLSDRIGRKPLLVACTVAMLVSAYPAMEWLVAAPSFTRLLGVELWFSLLYASYNGAMVVYLTELMPPEVRTAGFALAYSLATALFGGFTPAISTYLIHISGDRAIPGVWLSLAAACGLTASLLCKATPRLRPQPS
jgi:MFS family permease